MLADVVKEREKKRVEALAREHSIYNRPYKRDIIIYFCDIHVIGGIETWIYNLGKRYEFSVVYDKADIKQLERLNEIGIETIKNVGQHIECNTLMFPVFNGDEDATIKTAKIQANFSLNFIFTSFSGQKSAQGIGMRSSAV